MSIYNFIHTPVDAPRQFFKKITIGVYKADEARK